MKSKNRRDHGPFLRISLVRERKKTEKRYDYVWGRETLPFPSSMYVIIEGSLAVFDDGREIY